MLVCICIIRRAKPRSSADDAIYLASSSAAAAVRESLPRLFLQSVHECYIFFSSLSLFLFLFFVVVVVDELQVQPRLFLNIKFY